MIWVWIILSINQGLRIEECITLTYEHFMERYFDIDESSHVDSLMMWVCGKRDESNINLVIWEDHFCPEFSPVRLLLLWIRVAGIKGGYLFPTLELLGKGNYANEHYGYKFFCRILNF